jgi:hypothetical protein
MYFVFFVLVKCAKVNADEGFEAVESTVDHLSGVSKRVVIKLLDTIFSVFDCRKTFKRRSFSF